MLDKLFLLGTTKSIDNQRNRAIILSNQVATVLGCIALPYGIIFYIIGLPLTISLPILPMTLIFWSCLLLNRYHFHKIACTTLILSANIDLAYYGLLLPRESGVQVVFISLAILPWLLFNFNEKNGKRAIFSGGL